MKKIHLLWIIPLTALISGIYAYNSFVDAWEEQREWDLALDELDENMDDIAYTWWATYEYYCPDVFEKIQTGEILPLSDDQVNALYSSNSSRRE